MALPWFKVYADMMTDPKIRMLNSDEFRLWITMLCIAGKLRQDGKVYIAEGLAYSSEALADEAKVPESSVDEGLAKMVKLKMIHIDEEGIIVVLNFDKRQYEKPSDRPEAVNQRVKRSRAKAKVAESDSKTEVKNQEGDTTKNCNTNVTPLKRQSNAIDLDIDLDLERDIEKDKTEEEVLVTEGGSGGQKTSVASAAKVSVYTLFEREFGRSLTPLELEQVGDLDDRFGFALIREAMRRAAANGVRKLRYVQRILESWEDAGVKTLQDAFDYEELVAQQKAKSKSKSGRDSPPDLNKVVELQKKGREDTISAAVTYIRFRLGASPPQDQAREIAVGYGEDLVDEILSRLYPKEEMA